MTLTDTGPLVALVDADDAAHASCLAVLPRMTRPLLTTWPCFTEAMYLVGSAGGYPAQDELWEYLEDGLIQIHKPDVAEYRRMRVLMRQYRDTPMDLGDASLVVAAEVLNVTRIFTIDSDFRVYRIHRKTPFEIIP